MSTKLLNSEPTWKERVKEILLGNVNAVIIDPEHENANNLEIELREIGCQRFKEKYGTGVIVKPGNEKYYF